jgi:hypothetical protein
MRAIIRQDEKRKSPRLSPGRDNIAQIDPFSFRKGFEPRINALILDKSRDGFGIVAFNSERLRVGEECKIKAGAMPPVTGQIVWKQELNSQVVKLGIKVIN